MRSIRRRLTLSNLMVAVVAFALSVKLGMAYSHSGRYWDEAAFYNKAWETSAWMADFLESEENVFLQGAPAASPPATNLASSKVVATTEVASRPVFSNNLQGEDRKEAAKRARSFANHLAALRSKYRWAAFFPWLPTAPDVP